MCAQVNYYLKGARTELEHAVAAERTIEGVSLAHVDWDIVDADCPKRRLDKLFAIPDLADAGEGGREVNDLAAV